MKNDGLIMDVTLRCHQTWQLEMSSNILMGKSSTNSGFSIAMFEMGCLMILNIVNHCTYGIKLISAAFRWGVLPSGDLTSTESIQFFTGGSSSPNSWQGL